MRVLRPARVSGVVHPFMAFRFSLSAFCFSFTLHSLLRLVGEMSQACSAKILQPIVGGS